MRPSPQQPVDNDHVGADQFVVLAQFLHAKRTVTDEKFQVKVADVSSV